MEMETVLLKQWLSTLAASETLAAPSEVPAPPLPAAQPHLAGIAASQAPPRLIKFNFALDPNRQAICKTLKCGKHCTGLIKSDSLRWGPSPSADSRGQLVPSITNLM